MYSASVEQEQRLEEDPWESEVAKWLADFGGQGRTLTEVMLGVAKPLEMQNTGDLKRISGIMRKLGYRPKGAGRPRRWYKNDVGLEKVLGNKTASNQTDVN